MSAAPFRWLRPASLVFVLSSAAASGAASGAAPAAVQIIDTEASEKGVFTFDYGVPTSPALVLAGQSPDKISTSTALKPFVLQLPTAAGSSGQTIGLDVAPAWLLPGSSQASYTDYMGQGLWGRLAYRTHFGAAVAQGIANADATKAQPSRLAIGFSASLLDSSDPLMAQFPGQEDTAWHGCVEAAKPVLQKQLDLLDTPDKARGQLEEEHRSLVKQRDALFNERAGFPEQLSAIQKEMELLNSDVERYEKLKSHAKPPSADQSMLDGLVDDKIKSLTALIGLREKSKNDIQTRQAEIDSQVKSVQDKITANDKKLTDITQADATKMQAGFVKSPAAKLLSDCVDQANTAARFAPSLSVGAGALWDGAPGQYAQYKQEGYVGWLSFRHALGTPLPKDTKDPASVNTYWMWGLSGRASWHELLATGVTATPQVQANTVDAGLGLERLSADTRLSGQIGYQYRDPIVPLAAFQRSRFRYYVAATHRIGPKSAGVWLQLGYGDVTETANDRTVSLSLLFSAPTTSIFSLN